jgi:cobalamin biosynthetic protein CobC
MRDHGGNLDLAIDLYGGRRSDWIDLSTGINPIAYPIGRVDPRESSDLPSDSDLLELEQAARTFWTVPSEAQVVATNGASAAITALPFLLNGEKVSIEQPTYSEYDSAFRNAGWQRDETAFDLKVLVHPNNPTGKIWTEGDLNCGTVIVDESFSDVVSDRTLISHSNEPGRIFVKSFGKFWGLPGLRLGFIIGVDPVVSKLRELLGPWPVGGGTIRIGTAALNDNVWATSARIRLKSDARKLDDLMSFHGAVQIGGCDLFRLYEVDDAESWREKLAINYIWTRIFPYSKSYIRVGLPGPADWRRLEETLDS